MTTHRITTALGLVLSAATIVSACGGDGKGNGDRASAADSPYCKTARGWTAHEMTTIDESDPAQLKTYIGEYVAFNAEAAKETPAEIATDWKMTSSAFESTVVPVLEKYGYSIDRIMAEATPEEQAVQEPPPDLAAAQDRIHAYEARICMTGSAGRRRRHVRRPAPTPTTARPRRRSTTPRIRRPATGAPSP